MILAAAPSEWIWLDCACAPQDADSFTNGNCLKVIWNIGHILEKATGMLAYYAIDGLANVKDTKFSSVFTKGNEKIRRFPDGLFRLLEIARGNGQGKCEHQLLEGARRSSAAGQRLWCMFEKLYGSEKLIRTDALAPLQQVIFRGRYEPDSKPGPRRRWYRNPEIMPFANAFLQRQPGFGELWDAEIDMVHSANVLSLECFDSRDLDPLTTILYNDEKLPAIFSGGLPRCTDSRTGILSYGVKLPKRCTMFGWYDMPSITFAEPCAFFRLKWPQADDPRARNIVLSAHWKCIQRCEIIGVDIWAFDPSTVSFEYSGNYGDRRYTHPCILCPAAAPRPTSSCCCFR